MIMGSELAAITVDVKQASEAELWSFNAPVDAPACNLINNKGTLIPGTVVWGANGLGTSSLSSVVMTRLLSLMRRQANQSLFILSVSGWSPIMPAVCTAMITLGTAKFHQSNFQESPHQRCKASSRNMECWILFPHFKIDYWRGQANIFRGGGCGTWWW